MSDTRNIIDFALDDNAKEMRESLYASIHDRISAHIESKKQEVASTMLGMPLSTESVETEDEVLDEEKEDEHEDAEEDEAMCKSAAKKEVKKHEKNMHNEKD